MIDEDGLSDDDWTIAIVQDRHILSVADGIDVNDPREGGRPAHFHPYAMLVVHVLTKRVYGGRLRKAIRQLRVSRQWKWLRSLVAETYPDRPDIWLPEKAPRRHHYLHFRNTYLTSDAVTSLLDRHLTLQGAALATSLGLCQPGGSINSPTRKMMVIADGKRISPTSCFKPGTPASVDEATGEVLRYRRSDPDIRPYMEGGAKYAEFGHRYVTVSTRGDGYYERALLGIRPAPRSETSALMPLIDTLNSMLAIGFIVYDTALRGSAIDELVRRFGILSIAPVTAEKAETEKQRRVDREVRIAKDLEAKHRDDPTAKRKFNLGAYRGAACEIVKTEDGSDFYEPLTLIKLALRKNKDRTHRLYGL